MSQAGRQYVGAQVLEDRCLDIAGSDGQMGQGWLLRDQYRLFFASGIMACVGRAGMATAERSFSKVRTIKQHGHPARVRLLFCFGGAVTATTAFGPDSLFGRLVRLVLRRHVAAPQIRAEHRADGFDETVRVHHRATDIVDTLVVQPQLAGVSHPFNDGETVLLGAVVARTGQADLGAGVGCTLVVVFVDQGPQILTHAGLFSASVPWSRNITPVRKRAWVVGGPVSAAAAIPPRHSRGARSPSRRQIRADVPCCTWPAASYRPSWCRRLFIPN